MGVQSKATGSSGETVKKTYLIWDPGFGRYFALTLVAIIAAVCCAANVDAVYDFVWESYQEMLFKLMEGAHRMAWWSAIGLLSSSCCALQLLLNLVNFGCAGFNTYLGPLRPGLCAVTVCIQAGVWYTAAGKPFQWVYVAPCTLLAAVLTLMPEMLSLWVQRTSKRETGNRTEKPLSKVVFALDGMGCAACTSKIAKVLDSLPVVLERDISLEHKEARVSLSVGVADAQQAFIPDALRLIGDAGFQVKLSSLSSISSTNASAGAPSATVDSKGVALNEGCQSLLAGSPGGLPLSFAAGLLSSSCCFLQLGVNLLTTLNVAHGIGCAGFNKVLGPYRTILRCFTGVWLFSSWAFALWRRKRVRWLLAQTIFCLSLTFLPEALLQFGGPAIAPPTDGAEVVRVKVDGMGCEACQMHVQGVMDQTGGVVSSRVDFQSGYAEVVVNKGWAFDFASMAKRLEDDGYTAKVRTEF